MTKRLVLLLLSVALLASCAQQSTLRPPPQQKTSSVTLYTVQLYRALRVTAAPGGNTVDWTDASFRVSGNPGTLSLSDRIVGAAITSPCWLRIDVDLPGVGPAAPNDVGDLTIPAPPPVGANAGPWQVLYDDVPPGYGHWSIARATIGGTSNNTATPLVTAVLSAMAHAPVPTATVVDGTVVGCH